MIIGAGGLLFGPRICPVRWDHDNRSHVHHDLSSLALHLPQAQSLIEHAGFPHAREISPREAVGRPERSPNR